MHYALYKEGICSTAKKEVSRGINWVWDQRRKKSSLITNLNYNARDLKPQNLFYSCGLKCRPKKKETHIGSKSFFRFHPQRKRWRKGNNWIILHRLLSRLLYHQKNVGRIFVYLCLPLFKMQLLQIYFGFSQKLSILSDFSILTICLAWLIDFNLVKNLKLVGCEYILFHLFFN